mmetsp:Transcript_43120/g.107915  ORF Transcript_43120/g.107915 Transcript_43120/m.107915 type:complete len:423 (-) Transcript_43120:1309-2577(-)
MGPEICLEAKGIDDGKVCLDVVKGRPGLWDVSSHVTPTPGKDRVDGRDAVGGGLDLDIVDRLHQARRRHQERRVGHAAGRGDDLASPPVHWRSIHGSVQNLELAVPDGFVAQRPLARPPLKPLHHTVLDVTQQLLVHLARQGVIHEDVGAVGLGAEGPDAACGKNVPVVLLLEEGGLALAVPRRADQPCLDILSKPLLQRFTDESDLVPLVGRLRKALEGRCLDDCLAKGDRGVRRLDLNLRVHLAEVVHDAVEEELPRPEDQVLPRLLHLGRQEREGLVDFAEPVEHLGQLRGVEGLEGELDDGPRGVLEGPKDALLVDAHAIVHDRRRLDNRVVNATYQDEHTGRGLGDGDPVSALVEPQIGHGLDSHILIVVQRVPLPEHAHQVPHLDRAAHHPPKRVKRRTVGLVVELDNLHGERPLP